MTPDTFLTAENIVKRFGTHTALDGVSISVPRGRVFGLLGPNGAGKTTLIRIINRITVPDSGTITFDGHPFGADDVQRIGYLPEERGLYKKMKVGEQAVYLASLRGLSAREAKARLQAWFEKFGIESWWNKKLEELSKGMQQKVHFIITAVLEPDLLILDEPFSGFDPVNAELLKKEILALRDKGATIIFSTHNMASVEEVCDDIALIHKSHVVLQGQVTQIKEEHRTGCYEVVATEGTLKPVEGVFDVTGSTAQRHVTTYRLAKAAGVSNADLARAVAEQVEPRSFCEVMPSMNEIFLKIVGA